MRSESSRDSSKAAKPLPLKQRTSSRDTRRDYSERTWISLLRLLKPREYFLTVDHFSIWRRHLAWAMDDGADLQAYISQRYASSMVFMSLLLGAELNVLFNSSGLATNMRQHMKNEDFHELSFWIGVIILLSVVLTMLSIISTFTAWGMVNAVSETNAHCVLRSSIGQYVAQLPGRFIFASVYSFLLWVILCCFVLLPVGLLSVTVVVISLALFVHVVVVFSAFGRIIMHSGAMGKERIFEKDFERSLLPLTLHSNLLGKAMIQLESKTSIMRQYRFPAKPLARSLSVDSFSVLVDGDDSTVAEQRQPHPRRKNSAVRFADNLLATSSPVTIDSPLSTTKSPSVVRKGNASSSRPPRPGALKFAESPLGERILSDSSVSANNSVVSVEEWLRGNHKAQAGGHKEERGHGTQTAQSDATPVTSTNIEIQHESMMPQQFSNMGRPPDATSSSDVGPERYGTTASVDPNRNAEHSHGFWKMEHSLKRTDDVEVGVKRNVSVLSDVDRSEEDEFYREYGHLFDSDRDPKRDFPKQRKVSTQTDLGEKGSPSGDTDILESAPLLRSDGRELRGYDTRTR